MKFSVFSIGVFLLFAGANLAQAQNDPFFIDATAGPGGAQSWNSQMGNIPPNTNFIVVRLNPGTGNENTFHFNEVNVNGDAFLITGGDQTIEIGPAVPGQIFNLDGTGANFRFSNSSGNSTIRTTYTHYTGWNPPGDGAVHWVGDNATLDSYRSWYTNNQVSGDGGVTYSNGNGRIRMTQCVADSNSARNGGVYAIYGNSAVQTTYCTMRNNNASSNGCLADINSSSRYYYNSAFALRRSQYSGTCAAGWVHTPNGWTFTSGNTCAVGDQCNRTVTRNRYWNTYMRAYSRRSQAQADQGLIKPEANCEDFGSGAIESLGFNFSEDNSCGFNQATDVEDEDGMSEFDANEIVVPEPGSPLIDTGPVDVQQFPGQTLASLPCGYRDVLGVGAPQDANNDGEFECDRGAVEVPFDYALTPGHSAAFFNSLRNGEGQYVEMLSETLAIVYTFTHRPDGSGPMWFIGVGYVLGNSIVIDNLLRPSGTSFGDGFVAADIVNNPVGGQSMVFNDCEAADAGGNVAYSGNLDVGIEALITRAGRLSNILGCGSQSPHPNAGLSGSYFLPSRNGEGIVVQWLPDGQVLVIFFTYDLNGDQQWVLGIGQSDGFSVTMDAVYASGNSSWGSGFNPDEVVLTPWGTFELNWSECGGVQFIYNSTVSGYGSATRDYSRLSSLWGANCPDF